MSSEPRREAQAVAAQGCYAHIILSPHLDDAALSVGGTIARLTVVGEAVLVVNICSGSPPLGGPFSSFAALQHTRWKLPADEAVALRRAEDAAALAILGADSLQLDLLDAIYRMPEAYIDDETLFGAVAPDDPLAELARPSVEAIVAGSPAARVYAPLGVGNHVDHQAVYAVAAELAGAGVPVLYYEDFPYAARQGSLAARLSAPGAPRGLAPVVTEIAGELERKIIAVAAYESQLGTLFGDGERMAQMVAAYAAAVAEAPGAYAERLWAPQP
jgi:LmbE family N-acetylglucosaminyl deacetylase